MVFFCFPAHQFEPEVKMSALSFMSLSSPFWNPWTALLAWIMSFCTYPSYRIKLTPFLSYTLQFYTSSVLGAFLRGFVFYWKNSEQFQSTPGVYIFVLSPSGFSAYREVILFNCVTWRDSCDLLSIQVSFLCAAFQSSC